MLKSPIPTDEEARLAELRALEILDSPAEERFDRFTRLATHIFDLPIAYISLIDESRQWFKSQCGLDVKQTARDISFCGHAINSDQALIIPDTRLDERFKDNPLVVGEPYVRFYAGQPLAGPRGYKIGTFCLVDRKPRSLSPEQFAILKQLGQVVEEEINLRNVIHLQKVLAEMRQEMAEDLKEAAKYWQSALPAPMKGEVDAVWRYTASAELGGDAFNYYWLDNDTLAIYLLDVCGHGISAALLSISIINLLRSKALPGINFADPAMVLSTLNRTFPMEENRDKFFTMWYGVYRKTTRTLTYANAGHPPPVLFEGGPRRGAKTLSLGESSGLVVGAKEDSKYTNATRKLPPESQLLLFSDGVFDFTERDGSQFSYDKFFQYLSQKAAAKERSIDDIIHDIESLHDERISDDFSLMELIFH